MRPPNSASNNHSNSSGSKNSATDDDNDIQILDAAGGGGGSARRPRGRPSGSKNKPKPPIVITRDSPTALRSNVIEIAGGADVIDAVAALARRRQRGISILSGSGTVSNVSIRQPRGAVARFVGDFEIICVQGAFLPLPSLRGSSGMTVFLVGEQGQIVGGRVAGELLASSTVTLIAASFANATLERLPLSDEVALQQQQQQNQKQQEQQNQEMNSGSTQSQECEDQVDLEVDLWTATPASNETPEPGGNGQVLEVLGSLSPAV